MKVRSRFLHFCERDDPHQVLGRVGGYKVFAPSVVGCNGVEHKPTATAASLEGGNQANPIQVTSETHNELLKVLAPREPRARPMSRLGIIIILS